MDYNTSITESQERKPKHCGLDVREEGRHEEVQKDRNLKISIDIQT